jgi:hypothetical protein
MSNALTNNATIAGVLLAFLTGTLLAGGRLVYVLGEMTVGGVLTAWAGVTLLIIIMARLLSVLF